MKQSKRYQYTNQKEEFFVSDVEDKDNIEKSKAKLIESCNEYFGSEYKNITACQEKLHRRAVLVKALLGAPSKRQIEADKLKAEIKEIYTKSKYRYGAPKIQKALESLGKHISLKRVQRYMSSMELHSIVVKKFRPHSSKPTVEGKENIINRNFKAASINEKWCTHITYIYTLKDGWTYLASVIDLYSKKIIGYAYGTSMTAELAVKAVKNACLNVKNTKGIILHSDLGTQYTSHTFEDYLSSKGIAHSFSRQGNPYDNACIESFHSVLKKEESNHHKYYDSNAARKAIFEYIESWYNRQRIHSAIHYMIPQAVYEAALVAV